MRGRVLEFKTDGFTGLVSGDDGRRYRFTGADWRGLIWPVQGEEVDFVAEGDGAHELFPVGTQSEPVRWRHFLFSFVGRITRQQYWLRFILPYAVLSVLLAWAAEASGILALQVLRFLVGLFFIWPSIAVGTKRCHDRDRSGWFQLIVLIPIVGAIWLLIDLGFLRGTKGPNSYGPDPLRSAAS